MMHLLIAKSDYSTPGTFNETNFGKKQVDGNKKVPTTHNVMPSPDTRPVLRWHILTET